MNDWQRMLNGEMYNDFSDDLFKRRVKAKELFRRYNRTEDCDTEERRKLLTELLGHAGKELWVEPDFRCEYGSNIYIGDRVYINFDCIILDCAKITVGDDVLFGPRVGLYAANHAIDPEERAKGGCIGKPITIGSRVWIGGDVKIVGGVTIGDDSIIGTGSIVTKDIPAGVIVVGNPCRVKREITEKDKTDYMERMQWQN